MSQIRRWAGQVLVAGYPSGDPPSQILDALARDSLAGVILFKRNLTESPAAIARQIEQLAQATHGHAPLVAVDQEGGRVARLGAPILELPPMRRLGEIDDPDLTRRAARTLGRQLAALGFNVDFAPVLDVATNPKNQVIGDRSFGSDPVLVARHGLAFAAGLKDAGLLACGKHFPGHGDTVEDSHFELPALPHQRARLDSVELIPFRAAVGEIDSLMTAHIVFHALDSERPATLSRPVITGLLREQIGYGGLVVSDDLEMQAIADHWAVGSAAIEALRAGCDLVLVCRSPDLVDEARDALAAEAEHDEGFRETLERAATRVAAVRAGLRCAPIVDEPALAARLDDPEVAAVAAELQRRAPRSAP